MEAIIKKIFFVFCLIMIASESYYCQNTPVYMKAWVKKNEVLLRWAPFSKSSFDLGFKNGYKITRIDQVGNSIVVAESKKALAKTDTAWVKLIRTNKNAILVFAALYDNVSKSGELKKKMEEERMMYNMMLLNCDFDADLANAAGLMCKDLTVEAGKTYTYSVSINNLPAGSKLTASTITVNTQFLSENPEIRNLSGIFRNKSVKLKWNAATFKNDFAAYNIERSVDSINYLKLNKSPLLLLASEFEKNKEFIYYLDTFPSINKKYYFRIRGLNHFGEWSDPSNVVSAIGFEPLKSFPVFDTIHSVNNQTVFMRWSMQDKKENTFPKEYLIVRSEKDAGPYIPVFKSASLKQYTDLQPNAINFYKVAAISYGGDTLYSYSYMALINDTIPPSVPVGLKGKADAKGKVTLSWDKNTESDLQGYKIYRSNALHEEFVQINNEFAKQETYFDRLNLKTLSKKIYYCVSATDNRFNNSALSAPVEIIRPDTIAPVAPVLTKMELQTKGIKINWINSNSDDVKYYVLYRTCENQPNDLKLKEWPAKDSLCSFLDTNLIAGEGYRYKLIVSDEDDNISISNRPYIRFETGFRKKIDGIQYLVNRTAKTVLLSWKYEEKEVEKFIIYRCKKGEQLTIIKTIPASCFSYTDTTLFMGNVYEYRIKPVFSNGAEGIISDKIEVEY